MADAKIRLSIDGVQAVTGGLKDVGEKIGSVSRSLSALTAIGGALSIGAFVGMIKESIDAADSLKDLSKSTSIAVEDLAGLKLLARQTGTDLDGLAKGINKMSVEMGKSPEKFKALGITAKDNIGAFRQLADMFNTLEDANLRNALAQSIFGKSWAELAPALSEGGAAIGATIEKGKRLAGVTTEMADAADEFNDKMAELAGTGGLMTRLVSPALPLMNALADDMIDAANGAATLNSSFNPLAETLRALIVVGGNVAFVLKAVGTEIGGIAAQVALFASGEFKAALMVGDIMKADADKARAAFDAWEAKMMAAGTAAKSAAKETVVMTQAQKDAAKEAERLAKKFIDVGADKQKAQDTFIDSLVKESETLRLGEAEAKLHQAAILGITGAKLEQVKAIVAEIDAYKEAVKVARARSDERNKEEEGIKEFLRTQTEGYNAAVKGSRDALKAAQDEYDQFGMTKSQIAEITLLTLQSTQAKFTDGSEGYNAAQKQIDAQRELIDVLKRGEARDASIKAAKETSDEWKSAWDSIERTAHDTFVSIFDSGKSAFDRLKDTLKNGLIDMLYQMTIKKWIINIAATGSMAGVSGAANAANTGSSLFNAGSTVASLFSAGSAMGGGSLASIASGSTYGTAFLSEQSLMLAAQEGAGAAATGLSTMSSISGALAAIPGWGWAALGAAAIAAYVFSGDGPEQNTKLTLGSSANAVTGSMDTGRNQSGGNYVGGAGINTAFGSFGVQDQFWIDAIAAVNKPKLDAFLQGVKASDDTLASYLTAAEKDRVTAALDNTKSVLSTGAEGSDPSTQYGIAFSQRITTILEGVEPGLASFIKGFTGTADALAVEAAALLSVKSQLAASPFENLKDLSFSAAAGLAQAAGGMDKLNTSLASYYDNFYSETEKTANLTASVAAAFASVGKVMPDLTQGADAARAAFRKLVDGSMLDTSAEGQRITATLLSINGAFAQLTPQITSVTEKAETLTDAMRSAADILNERQGLEKQLLQLQGDTAALRTLERDALDESNRSIYDQITALEDQRVAQDAATEALNASNAAASAILQERLGLERQLLQLQGDTTALRTIERNALNEANRSIYDQITALEDQKAAENAASETTKQAQAQIDQARNNLSAAYERESSALDSTIKKFQDFSKTLRTFRDSLLTGSLSPLSPEARYAQLKQQFDKTYSLAKSGDPAAMGDLQSISQQFLEASQGYLASSEGYVTDFDMVRAALDSAANAADTQVSIAQQQLDTLDEQVSALISINTGVLSVRDAIFALKSAQSGSASGSGSASSAGVAVSSAANNKGLVIASSDSALVAAAKVLYQSATGGVDSNLYDQYVGAVGGPAALGWNGDPASLRAKYHFADGGIFTNGIVSQPSNFNIGQMGENGSEAIVPLVRTPSGLGVRSVGGDNKETVELLRAVLIELRADKVQRGAVGTATLEKLELVADGLAGNRRVLARADA